MIISPLKTNRIEWIDTIKGICIILVIIYHTCGLPIIGQFLFGGFMGTFFILSGYTTKKDIISSGIKKKIERLLIPYFFYGIISILFITSNQIIHGNWEYTIKYIGGLIYSRYSIVPLQSKDFTENSIILVNSPLWFLTTIFISYIYFYFYINIKKKITKLLFICISIILCVITNEAKILLPWGIDISFICFLLLLYGYYYSKYRHKLHYPCYIKLCSIITIGYLYYIMVIYNGHINLSVRIYGNHGVLSIILFYCICIIETRIFILIIQPIHSIITKILAIIGKHSLRIMCIHIPLSYIESIILSTLNININQYLSAIILIIITLFFNYILIHIFKRVSIHKNILSRSVKYL